METLTRRPCVREAGAAPWSRRLPGPARTVLSILSVLTLVAGCADNRPLRAAGETDVDCIERVMHQSVGGGAPPGGPPFQSAVYACRRPPVDLTGAPDLQSLARGYHVPFYAREGGGARF